MKKLFSMMQLKNLPKTNSFQISKSDSIISSKSIVDPYANITFPNLDQSKIDSSLFLISIPVTGFNQNVYTLPEFKEAIIDNIKSESEHLVLDEQINLFQIHKSDSNTSFLKVDSNSIKYPSDVTEPARTPSKRIPSKTNCSCSNMSSKMLHSSPINSSLIKNSYPIKTTKILNQETIIASKDSLIERLVIHQINLTQVL